MKTQINFWNDKPSLEYEVETIKEAIELAIKENADLWNADLRNADLRNADLRNANLRNADLRNADLRNADLWNADLRNADLRNADIAILSTVHQKYDVRMVNNIIKIGCECHTVSKWVKFTNREVLEMDGKDGLRWWKEYKPVIIPLAKLHIKKLKELAKPKEAK